MSGYRKLLIGPAAMCLSLTACITVVDNEVGDDTGVTEAERLAREDGIPVRGETPGRQCSTDGLTPYVGRKATSELGAAIMRDSNAAALRWIRPNDAVTMDYRPDRLNVKLDNIIVITGFSCG